MDAVVMVMSKEQSFNTYIFCEHTTIYLQLSFKANWGRWDYFHCRKLSLPFLFFAKTYIYLRPTFDFPHTSVLFPQLVNRLQTNLKEQSLAHSKVIKLHFRTSFPIFPFETKSLESHRNSPGQSYHDFFFPLFLNCFKYANIFSKCYTSQDWIVVHHCTNSHSSLQPHCGTCRNFICDGATFSGIMFGFWWSIYYFIYLT